MPRISQDPQWRDASLVIMGCLASGPLHGYAIMTVASEEYGLAIGPGTLYGALARLEERGLVEPLASEDPRRRPYGLTPRGRAVLDEQVVAMRAFARAVGRRLARPARLQPKGA